MNEEICWMCDLPMEEGQAKHGALRVHWTCAQDIPEDIRHIVELDGLMKAMKLGGEDE